MDYNQFHKLASDQALIDLLAEKFDGDRLSTHYLAMYTSQGFDSSVDQLLSYRFKDPISFNIDQQNYLHRKKDVTDDSALFFDIKHLRFFKPCNIEVVPISKVIKDFTYTKGEVTQIRQEHIEYGTRLRCLNGQFGLRYSHYKSLNAEFYPYRVDKIGVSPMYELLSSEKMELTEIDNLYSFICKFLNEEKPPIAPVMKKFIDFVADIRLPYLHDQLIESNNVDHVLSLAKYSDADKSILRESVEKLHQGHIRRKKYIPTKLLKVGNVFMRLGDFTVSRLDI